MFFSEAIRQFKIIFLKLNIFHNKIADINDTCTGINLTRTIISYTNLNMLDRPL